MKGAAGELRREAFRQAAFRDWPSRPRRHEQNLIHKHEIVGKASLASHHSCLSSTAAGKSEEATDGRQHQHPGGAFSDPMVKLVMERDRVQPAELRTLLEKKVLNRVAGEPLMPPPHMVAKPCLQQWLCG